MTTIYSIYKITNKINNKVYIGFTGKDDPRQRLTEHFYAAEYRKSNTKFYNALLKYKKSDFSFEVIYQSYDENHTLNVMEDYFINLYESKETGYNTTSGGRGTAQHRDNKSHALAVKKSWEKTKHKRVGKNHPMYGRKQTRCSCIYCKQEISFPVFTRHHGEKCMHHLRENHPTHNVSTCENCGEEFFYRRSDSSNRRFCSRDCYYEGG